MSQLSFLEDIDEKEIRKFVVKGLKSQQSNAWKGICILSQQGRSFVIR